MGEPVINYEEMIQIIHERLNIPIDTIRLVLDTEEDYLREKGIIID